MVIGKEKCYDLYGHPTSISGHNIIGLITAWTIDITEDIVAFVLAKITSCAKRVEYFVSLFGTGLDRFSGYQSSRNGKLQKKKKLLTLRSLHNRHWRICSYTINTNPSPLIMN